MVPGAAVLLCHQQSVPTRPSPLLNPSAKYPVTGYILPAPAPRVVHASLNQCYGPALASAQGVRDAHPMSVHERRQGRGLCGTAVGPGGDHHLLAGGAEAIRSRPGAGGWGGRGHGSAVLVGPPPPNACRMARIFLVGVPRIHYTVCWRRPTPAGKLHQTYCTKGPGGGVEVNPMKGHTARDYERPYCTRWRQPFYCSESQNRAAAGRKGPRTP